MLLLGGVWIYRKQPWERKETLQKVAGQTGTVLLDAATKAAAEVNVARTQLSACMVPGPRNRDPASAVLRELAISDQPLSAQHLAGLLDESVRLPIARLRAYLRANDRTLVNEVRRGGFALGAHYRLPE